VPFCRTCGAGVYAGSQFCGKCGRPLSVTAVPAVKRSSVGKKLGTAIIIGFGSLLLLGMIISAFRPSSSSTLASKPEWSVNTSRSPIDDSNTVVLSLDSENLIQGPLGSVKPTLIVRCKERKTDVYVVTRMAARIEEDEEGGPSNYHKVRIRIDDGVASSESWTEATDQNALFAPDQIYDVNEHYDLKEWRIAFARKLAGATTLIFEFTPFDGNPQTARFDLRGLDTHLDKVAEACGWL
jgi:type VI secretion system protein VasI